MAFESVEQDPDRPGVFRAKTTDGQTMIVHGQPGQELFDRVNKPRMGVTTVERPSAQEEPMTVGSALEQTASMNPLTGPAMAAYHALSAPTKRPEPTDAQLAAAGTPGAPAPTEQASAQGAPQPAAQQQPSGPVPLGYSMKGIDPVTGKEVAGNAVRMPDGSIGIYRPGAAGTAGGLTKLGKQALEHQGAAEEEYAKQQASGVEARQSEAEAQIQAAKEREDYLQEQRTQLLLQQQQQQDDNDKVQRQVDDLQSKYDKARDDFMNSKVDPDAYLKGRHGEGLFSMLGMALGAMGSALARTPDFAQEFVQSQIDRHIRSQETQIQVKGRAADNMLADLTRQTGSLQNGKLAMRQLLTERAAIEAQQVGASSKSQEIAARAQEVSSALAGQAALQDNARRQANLEHVMGSRLYFQPGSPGRTAGFIQPTQEQVAGGQQMGIAGRKLSLEEQKAAAQGAGGDKLGFRGAAAVAAARVARGAVAEMADAIGAKRDANGEYTAPAWGSIAASKVPFTETSQKVDALKGTLASEIGKAQTGGVLTEGAAKEMHEQIQHLRTPGDFRAFLNHYDRTMAEVEKQQRQVAGSVRQTGSEATEEAESR